MRSPCTKRRAFLPAAIVLLLLWTASAFGKTVRFAVISDTHVGSGTAAVDLQRVVLALNDRRDVECIFVTGDITEKGRDEEFAQAKKILSRLRLPWKAVAGNHDSHWIGAGLVGFTREFGRGDSKSERSGAAFFLLTSGEFGHLDPQELEWLAQEIARVPESKEVFILLHHPPPDVDDWAVVHNLIRTRPACIVAGHVHRGQVSAYHGLPVLTVRASKSANGKPPGYSIIEDTDKGISLDEVDVEGRTQRVGEFLKPETASPPPPLPEAVYTNFGVNVLWRTDLRQTLTAPPAASTETIFVAAGTPGAGRAAIVLIDAMTGRIRASLPGPLGEVISRPVASADGGTFFAADVKGRIIKADAMTGAVLKSADLGERLTSPLVLFLRGPGLAPGVLAGALSGRMWCLDAESLRRIWANSDAREMDASQPLVVAGRVVFGSWDARVHCLDLASGKQAWSWTEDDNFYYSPAGCTPSTDGFRIFTCSPDGYVSAIDLASGKTLWRENHEAWESLGISEDRKRLFVKSVRDEFSVVDAANGKLVLKASPAHGRNDTVPGVPVECGSRIVYGARDGTVYAVNGQGAITPLLRLGSAPVIWVEKLRQGVLAAADADGNIVVFEPDGPPNGPPRSPIR